MTQDGAIQPGTLPGTPSATPPAGVPSIDPRSWIEPKETFPGKVIVSAYRLCDPKYMEPNQFRTVALPRQIWQWDLRVERLDAVYQLPDGSQVPVVRYGGYDLERYNARTGQIEPTNLRSNKEVLIGNAWVTCFTTIEPPESLVGKMADFEFYPSKRIARNVAKNILLPIRALAPDWTFTGDKQVFVVTREAQEARQAATGGSAAGATGTSSSTTAVTGTVVSVADAETQLPALLHGKNRNDIAGLINSLPTEVRHGDIIDGLISGTLIEQLARDGKIMLGADGTIVSISTEPVPVTA